MMERYLSIIIYTCPRLAVSQWTYLDDVWVYPGSHDGMMWMLMCLNDVHRLMSGLTLALFSIDAFKLKILELNTGYHTSRATISYLIDSRTSSSVCLSRVWRLNTNWDILGAGVLLLILLFMFMARFMVTLLNIHVHVNVAVVAADPHEKECASRIIPLRKHHHQLLCTLLIVNSAANVVHNKPSTSHDYFFKRQVLSQEISTTSFPVYLIHGV